MSKWPAVPLKEHIIEVVSRKGDTSAEILSVTNTEGFIRSLDVFDKQVFSKDSSNYKIVQYNDIAYNPSRINVGSVARCQFAQGGAVSPMYTVVRCRETLLPQFLLYFLKSDIGRKNITHRSVGAVRFMLRFQDLAQIELPLPPVAEQERLLNILQEVEMLRQLRNEANSRLAQAVPATFSNLFGDPTSNPKRLPTRKLGDIATLERGKFTPRPRNDPSYFGGPYPFIQTGDISASGGLLSKWQQTLNERGKAVSKEFPAGTIVFAIVGATIGATAILLIPVYCTDSVVGIQVNPEHALVEYVEFILRARRPVLLAQAPDAARANLNLEVLRDIDIPLAPLNEQREFVEFLLEIRELAAIQAVSQRHIDHLFQSLLYRAFQGEL